MVESEFPSNMRFRGNRRPKAKRPNWFKNPIPCSSCLRFKRNKKKKIGSPVIPKTKSFNPRCSMYGIFTNIYPKKSPSYVGKYSSTMDPMGILKWRIFEWFAGTPKLRTPPIWAQKAVDELHGPATCSSRKQVTNEDTQPKKKTGWWLGHPSEKYEFVNWED